MEHNVDRKVLEVMLKAACHFGHRTSKWNPKMRKFIHGEREGIHIVDLVKTYECLVKAIDFLKDKVSQGKTVLFVCTKLQAKRVLEEAGKQTKMPYVTHKWIPGLLTNYPTIRKRIKYLQDLKDQESKGELERYTKKEQVKLRKIIEKLQSALGGVEEMFRLPDILCVFDCVRDKNAILEARRLKIPVVGIVDTNADPSKITYPIPGNDDAIKSLEFFVRHIADAVSEAKMKVSAPVSVPAKTG